MYQSTKGYLREKIKFLDGERNQAYVFVAMCIEEKKIIEAQFLYANRNVYSLCCEKKILKRHLGQHKFESLREKYVSLALDNVELMKAHMEECLCFENRIFGLSSKVIWLGRESFDFEMDVASVNAQGLKYVIA